MNDVSIIDLQDRRQIGLQLRDGAEEVSTMSLLLMSAEGCNTNHRPSCWSSTIPFAQALRPHLHSTLCALVRVAVSSTKNEFHFLNCTQHSLGGISRHPKRPEDERSDCMGDPIITVGRIH